MNADIIKQALAKRFSGTYAFFQEFRPFTGYAGHVNQIDAVAVGLYNMDTRIIAFEIKVSRADFKADVARFQHKHRFAVELSHEFYYVCPWGLIDKSEVPEVAGLMCVNKGSKVVMKKQAQQRNLECIPLDFFQAFARNFGAKIENAKVPIKYLGRNWTQEAFKKEIALEQERANKYWIKRHAEELYQKRIKSKSKIISLFDEIAEAAHVGLRKTVEEQRDGILDIISDGHNFRRAKYDVKQFIKELKRLFELKGD